MFHVLSLNFWVNALHGLCGSTKVRHNRLRAIWEAGHKLWQQFSEPTVMVVSWIQVCGVGKQNFELHSTVFRFFTDLTILEEVQVGKDHCSCDWERCCTWWHREWLQDSWTGNFHMLPYDFQLCHVEKVERWFWFWSCCPGLRLIWQDRCSEGEFWKLRKGFFRRLWWCNVFDANAFRTAEPANLLQVNYIALLYMLYCWRAAGFIWVCWNSQVLLALGSLPR